MNTRFLLVALLVLPSQGWQTADQTLEAKFTAVSSSYSISAPDWLHALVKVASDFQLPMGIEWIKVTDNPIRISRSWRDTTPLAILQDVVKAYPGYELEASNGVVHVFSAAMKGDRADVLNTRIGTFEVRGETVAMAAHARLANRVLDIMVPQDPNGSSHRSLGGSTLSGAGDGVVTFRIEDATVRDVLDKLCLSAGLNIWIVAYPPRSVKTRAGFLKTISLFDSVVRSDATFVPSWQFLPWGGGFGVIN
jgi:hypothetical protein